MLKYKPIALIFLLAEPIFLIFASNKLNFTYLKVGWGGRTVGHSLPSTARLCKCLPLQTVEARPGQSQELGLQAEFPSAWHGLCQQEAGVMSRA